MYTKKPKEMGSKLMICGLVYCLNYRLTIERIATMQSDIAPVWHKSCYSSFTSKSKISRLEKSKESVHTCASTIVLMEVLDVLCVVPQNQLTGLYACSVRSLVLLNYPQ